MTGGGVVVEEIIRGIDDCDEAIVPAWFAGIDSWLAGNRVVAGALPLAVCGLLVTAALAYVAIGRLAPSYGEVFTRLSETKTRAPKRARSRPRSTRGGPG